MIERYLDAFWASRWDEVLELLAEEALYVDPLLPDPLRGREAIRDILAYCHAWGTYRAEIVSSFASGRNAVVELRIRGEVTRPPEGMSASAVGKTFDFAECDVFELDREGRIARQTIYADVVTFQHQLGEEFK